MTSTASSLVDETGPLSAKDRALLNRRQDLLGRMMQILYGLLALGIAMFLAKDLVGSGKLDPDSVRDAIRFAGFMFGSFAVPHVILAWYEKRARNAVRLDLAGGIKLRRHGTLIDLEESAESEPSRFSILDDRSGFKENFALSSIVEIRRVIPNPHDADSRQGFPKPR